LVRSPSSAGGAETFDLAEGSRFVGAVAVRAREFVVRAREVDLVLVAMRSTVARRSVEARLAGARVSA
jgi:hypothetical protein